MKFSVKLTLAIISFNLIVGVIIGLTGLQATYKQVEEAVGLEVLGCANITTGLVSPADIERILQGDTSLQEKLNRQVDWAVDHKELFREAFILSLDGKLLVLDKRMQALGAKPGDSYPLEEEYKEHIISMKHGVYTGVYEWNGARVVTGYAPIFQDHDASKEIVGLMVINFDAEIILERTLDILWIPAIIGIVVVLIATVVIYFLIRRLVQPIVLVSKRMNQIADGNLTVEPLTYQSKDEVGQLCTDTNRMMNSLRQLISEINQTSMQVASASEQLTASADQTGSASEAISDISQELASGSEEQLHSLQKSAEIVNTISESMQDIADSASNTAKIALTTADKATTGRQAMNSVVSQMDAIRSTVTHLAETIDSLSRHSKEIVEITNDISDISAQTNMLSLNAAIEAARAGEQGRGFAVVSDSVRKLAVQTKDSTEKITAIVNAIVASMELAATNMTSAFKEVEDGAGLVHRAGEEFERIQAASMDTANHAEAVSEAVDRISQGAGQIVESIRIALQHAGRTVDGAQGVSAATEEQLATMQEISASANMLSHMAEELHTLIDRFRM